MRYAEYLLALSLMLIVSGCASVSPLKQNSAVCDGLKPLVDAHVDGLIADGGPRSLSTGRRLVVGYDAGCEED